MRTLLFALIPLLTAAPVCAQQVIARVVDARTRQPVDDVRVTVLDSAQNVRASDDTNRDGFFRVQLPAGSYSLVLDGPGYELLRQALVVTAEERQALPAILITPAAVSLDPLHVASRDRRREETTPAPLFVLAGARLAELERVNASPATLYRELAPGVRVKQVGGVTCVETSRGPQSMNLGRRVTAGEDSCDALAVVLDGMLVHNGAQILRSLQLRHYESIEYLNPIETGFRYGLDAGPGGAIVLWTRGFGPHSSPERSRGGPGDGARP